MARASIGIDIDDFRLDVKAAIHRAAELSFSAIEVGATQGDLAAWDLSSSARRHFARFVSGQGLHLAALTADVPHARLSNAATVQEAVDRTRQVLDLAADIDVPIVVATLSTLTAGGTREPLPHLVEALGELGEFAESRGRILTIRPSVQGGEELLKLLRVVDCRGVQVCLDPGGLVMHGINPMAAFEQLAERIALVHARDATVGSAERAGREAAFGQGEVDLIGVLAAVQSADYRRPFILRRTESRNAIDDLVEARDVLRGMLPPG